MLMREKSEKSFVQDRQPQDGSLFQAIVANAAEGIIALDERGHVTLMNPAAERLFGYQRDELIGRNVTMLMPEPYRSEYNHHLRRYLATGKGKILGLGREVMAQRKDGSIFPMYLSVAEVRVEKGRFFAGIMHDLTRHKQAEEAARKETEERFRQVAAITGEWIWEQDPSGCYIYSSSAVKDILGYEPEEVLDKNYLQLFTPEQRGSMATEHPGSVNLQDRFFRLMNRYRHKDGREVITESTGEPIFDAEGRLIKWRGVDRDITARKRAEDALRESEEELRLTLDNAPIGIVTVDLEGQFLNVNPASCTILRYSAEELLQKTLMDIAHPDDQEAILSDCRALVQGEIAKCEFERRYVRKDGAVITIRVRAGLIRDAQDKPLLIVGEFEDVTERKRQAQELQRMRAYLKNIIDSMPSILVGVDTAGQVTEWNKAAEQATGVPASKAIGRGFAEVLPELEAQLNNVREAIRRHAPVCIERLATEKEGEVHYADVMVYPLVADGFVGAVIRVDDITNRVRIEQMMVQTEKMMSVGGLAAGMAHEINNPLSGVLQSCQNISRRLSPDLPANRQAAEALGLDLARVHRYLQERGILGFVEGVQEAASRASRIVADMLAFSRRSTIEFMPTRLDEVLEAVVRLAGSDYDLKKKYDFKQIEIVRDYDPNLGVVYCDRTEIEQVFLNLIKNAAQAMAEGGRPPHRLALRTRQEGGYAHIEIEDNGPGMDEKTQRRVFEPFFTTKPPGIGTGLGLSVSYFIVTEQHKGTITVSSAPGKGACFVIRLPFHGRSA